MRSPERERIIHAQEINTIFPGNATQARIILGRENLSSNVVWFCAILQKVEEIPLEMQKWERKKVLSRSSGC